MCKPSDPRRRHLAGQPNASKRHLIIMPTLVDVPEIKLIRTDTTLDLSQKAEKVCFFKAFALAFVPPSTKQHVDGRTKKAAKTPPKTH